jgi:hypothetical protein
MKTNASIRNVPHKNSRFGWLAAAAFLLGGASVASAQGGCSGDGCSYIAVTNRGGCMILVNKHESRAIKVYGARAVPTFVWTVYAQSEQAANTFNGCLTNWYSQGHVAELQ